MLPVLIFVASFAMLVRFAGLAWRSRLLASSRQPISPHVTTALGFPASELRGEDFEHLQTILRVCPALPVAGKSQLPFVRAYFMALRCLTKHVASSHGSWNRFLEQEMSSCVRYFASRLDQRLLQNRACLAECHNV
jgi:hypothetical protein